MIHQILYFNPSETRHLSFSCDGILMFLYTERSTMVKNTLLRTARRQKGWNQQQLADFAQLSLSTIERAENGKQIRIDSVQQLCECLGRTPEELGLIMGESKEQENDIQPPINDITSVLNTNTMNTMELWHNDLLSQGITALQDLYFNGQPHQVEAILPFYCNQTASLSRQSSSIQQEAAKLASLAHLLACELFADRENFGAAEQAGKASFMYGQIANDVNLQVASLIGLGNIAFHRKWSSIALHVFQKAISLMDHATSLLKGRTYAGITEVYAMRGQYQETMQALELAYKHFPLEPEKDPAYPYLRASRYALYVFGDAQSRLFLNQPKEANDALIAMQKETNDPEIEPITKLDLLYYQAEVQIQKGEIDQSIFILTEAASLAKNLGSCLYFDKLVHSYNELNVRWPKEKLITQIEELFLPWDIEW
jgi:transcriptional regulator with XRE-family HTH domain